MRGLISAAAVAVAVLLQLAVADRITFPGGTGPDLVLLTVAALALANGPMSGVLTGFCAGLVMDVAPPPGHLVGEDALVFCLVGYACGLLAIGPGSDGVPEQEHAALFEIGVTAAGAAVGEALAAGLGVVLSDPRVTWPAIKHVLPVAIGYDVLLSPFVLFAAAAMLRLAGAGAPASRTAASAAGAARRRAAWTAVPSSGAVRQVAGTGAPKLRLSGSGKGDAWLGGARGNSVRTGTARPATARHEPRFAKTSATSRPRAGARLAGARLDSTRLGASLLGGSVFSRSSSPLARLSAPFVRSSPLSGRSRPLTRRGVRSGLAGATGLAGGNGVAGTHRPRFRKASALSRLVQSLRPTSRRKSPGKGWLRDISADASRSRAVLGARGRSLSGRSLSRGSLGRTLCSRATGGRSPGRGWLRRSRGLGAPRIGPRIGSGRPRPARLRMRPRTLKKSWRRSGGFR